MKRKTNASSKIITVLIVAVAVVLSAALFCGVYSSFLDKGFVTPDISAFEEANAGNGERAVPERSAAALTPDVPSGEPDMGKTS